MTLVDLIPLWASIWAALLALAGVYFLMRCRIMRTAIDPAAPIFFQLFFTFFILSFTGLIQLADVIGMLLFIVVVVGFPPSEMRKKQLFSQSDWFAFSKFLLVVLVVMNLVLIKQKGLLFASDNIAVSRQEFFQGWGVFRRANEVGVGILIITAALLWEQRRWKTVALFALFACFIALTLGSRSGLLGCVFAYGAYLHFQKRKPSNFLLIAAVLPLVSVTMGIFYLMFGNIFLIEFAYRLLAECDGPVYFFQDKMQAIASVPLGYPFDIIMTALKLRSAPIYMPLGEFILIQHFRFDTLQGPNPQMFVESHALFHSFGILWYLICSVIFVWFRQAAANPYTFFFAAMFVGPLLVDSQYAFSQVFTLMLIFTLFSMFLIGRWLLVAASRPKRMLEAEN
jgi:hypothetical protein